MEIIIHGDKIKVTEAMKSYIEDKLGRLDKYLEDSGNIRANVIVKVKGHLQTMEITIPLKSFILRSEETQEDFYAAVDKTIDKLERQIRKNKTRLNKQNFDNKFKELNFDYELTEEETNEDEIIVKRKKLEMKPMDEEEAILEMNLLGHEFFVYKDMHTNSVNVLYRRKDGNYGLIETK